MKHQTNYKEGAWFAVPLRQGGYGIGVVARAKKACILAYLFGPIRESVPKFEEVLSLKAQSAVAVMRIGDLGLVNGEWPIIGLAASWDRLYWPMPVFIRREPFPPFRKWLVYYSDEDPTKITNEASEQKDRPDLPEDVLSGYGAAEIKLTKLLSGNVK